MSTDAWIEEHWIGEAVLPRPRRAPKLPALQVPHAPTCSRGNAALAAHAQSRDRARHPGDGLSSRQNGRNVVDQQARKLTQPARSPARRHSAFRRGGGDHAHRRACRDRDGQGRRCARSPAGSRRRAGASAQDKMPRRRREARSLIARRAFCLGADGAPGPVHRCRARP